MRQINQHTTTQEHTDSRHRKEPKDFRQTLYFRDLLLCLLLHHLLLELDLCHLSHFLSLCVTEKRRLRLAVGFRMNNFERQNAKIAPMVMQIKRELPALQ